MSSTYRPAIHIGNGGPENVLCMLQGSSVERSGAAQGLAEVLAVLGPEYLQALLPDILGACSARAAFTREGHLTLFKFLPLAIPDEFRVRVGLGFRYRLRV